MHRSVLLLIFTLVFFLLLSLMSGEHRAGRFAGIASATEGLFPGDRAMPPGLSGSIQVVDLTVQRVDQVAVVRFREIILGGVKDY